jgi:uncharacterized protein YndB with AHSA1/START domain
MNPSRLLACVLAWAASGSAHAQRTLEHQAVISAPVAEVWAAFTTSDGFESWAVAHAEIDLRVGGDMRTSYNPASNLHDEHTIVNRILSYDPQRMLSIQNVQAPAGFENAELFQQTWSVIYFEPIGESLTRVRVVGLGYGEGPEWDDIYRKFDGGNAYTLRKLQEKFAIAGRLDDDDRVLELLHQLIGGEWIHESTREDGSIFRVRNVIRKGPDGASLISHGWLGDASGMIDHGPTLAWRAPEAEGGGVWFHSIDQNGAVSSGRITLAGPDTVSWDWNHVARDGTRSRLRIEQQFVDNDHYRMTMFQQADSGGERELVAAMFERVEEAPPRFRTLRPTAAAPVDSSPDKIDSPTAR